MDAVLDSVAENIEMADTKPFLLGLWEKYEYHHNLKFSNEAIISAVKLSERYITDRF